MPKPPCEQASTHHSNDRVRVYCGRVQPVILCGYHNQRRMLAADAANAASREAIQAQKR